MFITNLDSVEKTLMTMKGAEKVLKQIPLSRAKGVPNFSFRVFTIEPGGHTPYHQHPAEHLNYIIEGRGVLITKDREHKVKKGDFALVQPEELHQYKNASSTQNLIMICAVPKEYE
jgi:quercetin dioxygenase-like cupin family protein